MKKFGAYKSISNNCLRRKKDIDKKNSLKQSRIENAESQTPEKPNIDMTAIQRRYKQYIINHDKLSKKIKDEYNNKLKTKK